MKVLLVEDHQMFREWLGQMLAKNQEFEICGEADNIQRALELVELKQPDVAIVDITLRGASGLELIKDLKSRQSGLPVLVLSMHDEMLYAERVLRAGGRGFISKHEASSTLADAIRKVISGEVFLSPKMTAAMLERLSGGPKSSLPLMALLTDRELEVFQLVGRGYNSRKIAEHLHLGESTVETYRLRMKEKLKIKSAAELYARAARWVLEEGM